MLKDISIHRPIWMGFDDLKHIVSCCCGSLSGFATAMIFTSLPRIFGIHCSQIILVKRSASQVSALGPRCFRNSGWTRSYPGAVPNFIRPKRTDPFAFRDCLRTRICCKVLTCLGHKYRTLIAGIICNFFTHRYCINMLNLFPPRK